MASAVISLNSVCAGSEHVKIDAQINGGPVRTFDFSASEILQVLSEEEFKAAILVIARIHCRGLTRIQARNELQAGIQVTTA